MQIHNNNINNCPSIRSYLEHEREIIARLFFLLFSVPLRKGSPNLIFAIKLFLCSFNLAHRSFHSKAPNPSKLPEVYFPDGEKRKEQKKGKLHFILLSKAGNQRRVDGWCCWKEKLLACGWIVLELTSGCGQNWLSVWVGREVKSENMAALTNAFKYSLGRLIIDNWQCCALHSALQHALQTVTDYVSKYTSLSCISGPSNYPRSNANRFS